MLLHDSVSKITQKSNPVNTMFFIEGDAGTERPGNCFAINRRIIGGDKNNSGKIVNQQNFTETLEF